MKSAHGYWMKGGERRVRLSRDRSFLWDYSVPVVCRSGAGVSSLAADGAAGTASAGVSTNRVSLAASADGCLSFAGDELSGVEDASDGDV